MKRVSPLLIALAAVFSLAEHAPANEVTRSAEALKKGDVKITRQIAKRVTAHALERYDLHDLVTEQEINETTQVMYDFLNWKLGSPTLVTSQWVAAGDAHFRKSYGDEAAALLLGVMDFQKRQPDLVIPEWFLDALDPLEKQGKSLGLTYFAEWSLDRKLAAKLTQSVRAAVKDEIRGRVRMHLPKAFDVRDRMVSEALEVRRTGRLDVDEQHLVALDTPAERAAGGLRRAATTLPIMDGTGGGSSVAGDEAPDTMTTEQRLAAIERRLARLEAALGAQGETGSNPAVAKTLETTAGNDSALPATRRLPAPVSKAGPAEPYKLEAVPDHKGRTGQLVIAYPKGAQPDTRVDIARAGNPDEGLARGYGPKQFELMPGEYQVAVSGKTLSGLPLKRGHKTVVPVGVLKINLSGNTEWKVLDADGEKQLARGYGSSSLALLPGRYHVSILDAIEPVTVEAGDITEF